MKTVSIIKPEKPAMPRRTKVAAYGRVSLEGEMKLHSLNAQVDYYNNLISRNLQWVNCGIYTDEGISGTHMANREGFNRMIDDAMAGKIDLIITKSVSRFARNTLDSLTTIRKLKDKGVECFFDKEYIKTGRIPYKSRVFCLFCCPFVAYLSLKSA